MSLMRTLFGLVSLFGSFALPASAIPVLSSEAGARVVAERISYSDSVDDSIDQLRTELDRAPKALVTELAKSKEPKAAEALIEVYDEYQVLGARLHLVKSLRHFAGVHGCEALAMQKLLDVASTDPERQLRSEAVKQLAKSGAIGREYLGILIESPAAAQVRVLAMSEHVKGASKKDHDFYRRLWGASTSPSVDQDKKKKKKSKEEKELEANAPKLGPPLLGIAELAFKGLITEFSEEELLKRASSRSVAIRATAQKEIYRRGGESAAALAESRFSSKGEQVPNRVLAAEFLIVHSSDAEDVLDELIEAGGDRDASYRLRHEYAQLFAKRAPDDAKSSLAKRVGRGKSGEKLFALEALTGFEDERGKLGSSILKLVKDKDRDVRELAAREVAERRVEGAIDALESRLEKAEDAVEATVYLRGLTRLYGQDPTWLERLAMFTVDERSAMRNAAIRTIVERGGEDVLETIEKALTHPDWSTRLLAVEAIEERRDAEAVGWLVAAIDRETGRMSAEISEALTGLTGQDFRRNASAWARWWADNQDGFEVIGQAELEKMEEEAEARRLEETTKATEFFGLKIDSQRLVFVIDTSGSMQQTMAGRYAGERGPQRITAAREELIKALGGLEPEALFAVIEFSDKAEPFEEGLLRASEESLEDAQEKTLELRANGGTNMYAGLEMAFELADCDTIVLLGDGAASIGVSTDPDVIRKRVASWNEDRGVKIHTVAIGVDLDILRWLAEDSGGQHVYLP